MLEYKTITVIGVEPIHQLVQELDESVNEYMKHGWLPCGNQYICKESGRPTVVLQPMIKQ